MCLTETTQCRKTVYHYNQLERMEQDAGFIIMWVECGGARLCYVVRDRHGLLLGKVTKRVATIPAKVRTGNLVNTSRNLTA
jgi:hypothetical protein